MKSIRIALDGKNISHINCGSSDSENKSQNNTGKKTNRLRNGDINTMRRREAS